MRRLVFSSTLVLLAFVVLPVAAHADGWSGSHVQATVWTRSTTVYVAAHGSYDATSDGVTDTWGMGPDIMGIDWDVSSTSPWSPSWQEVLIGNVSDVYPAASIDVGESVTLSAVTARSRSTATSKWLH